MLWLIYNNESCFNSVCDQVILLKGWNKCNSSDDLERCISLSFFLAEFPSLYTCTFLCWTHSNLFLCVAAIFPRLSPSFCKVLNFIHLNCISCHIVLFFFMLSPVSDMLSCTVFMFLCLHALTTIQKVYFSMPWITAHIFSFLFQGTSIITRIRYPFL